MANPAQRAEPRGIGTSGARDPLAREVKLLGALLGQVIVEQEGEDALDLVETRPPARRSPCAATRRRAAPTRAARTCSRRRPARPLETSSAPSASTSSSRTWPRRSSASDGCASAARAATRRGSRGRSMPRSPRSCASRAMIASPGGAGRSLSVGLVLTAHPTEARRRTLLVALRARLRLLDRLDDPRLTPAEDADDPAPAARGDRDPVAHGAAPRRRARAARRGAHDAGLLRRVAVRGHAAALPRPRSRARPRATGGGSGERTGRSSRRSCAGARGSAATATATRT